MFLPGAKQVAIAWGSGVSLHEVETGEEIWFQSVPTNLIAFDVQAQGKAFAAGLADGSVIIFDAVDGASRARGRSAARMLIGVTSPGLQMDRHLPFNLLVPTGPTRFTCWR